jgi:hypothetical protein
MGADSATVSPKMAALEHMAHQAYQAWCDPKQPEWSKLSGLEKSKWFSVVGSVMDASTLSQVRIAAIAECASMIQTSYPDHACTPATCAAIRSLSTGPAHAEDILNSGGIDGLARHLVSGDHPVSDAVWRVSLVRSDMTVYARRAIEWFGANFIAGHRAGGGV